jgi:hypothetical protein
MLEVIFPPNQQFKLNVYLSGLKMDFSTPGVQKRRGEIDVWTGGRELFSNTDVILMFMMMLRGRRVREGKKNADRWNADNSAPK